MSVDLLHRTANFAARGFITDRGKLIGRLARLFRNRQVKIRESSSVDRSYDSCRKLADEIARLLQDNLLKVWYPDSLDRTFGGYIQRLSPKRSEKEQTNKYLVCQARLAWTAAAAAGSVADLKDQYLECAVHGLRYLERVMRDEEFGGFHWMLDPVGCLSQRFGDEKHVYGIAFVIYAAAEFFCHTKDARALQLAVDTYRWLEDHAADREHGGYFEHMRRDGTPIPPPLHPSRDKRLYILGTLVGYKSMNSHLHLLEAYTLLYGVWPDKELRERLDHLLHIVRDRIAVAPGALNLYFTADWRPVPAHDSFGHDVEAAYLLTEATGALGRAEDPPTWSVARQLVDHALTWGWDEKYGGFYNKGETFFQAHDTRKFGWVQAEGLMALLLMHKRFGHETATYFDAFGRQWRFIRNLQIDHKGGSWHSVVTRDGCTLARSAQADETGSIYHYVRAMLHVSRALRQLSLQE